MTANEVGFDGSFIIRTGGNLPVIRLARSIDSNMGPDLWSTCVNDNINGQIKNTFIWWGKPTDPALYYRNHEGQLFKVNFEPMENNKVNDV